MHRCQNSLTNPELTIVRRLRWNPLTEFELAHEVAASSAYTPEHASERITLWLKNLRELGYVWTGQLSNQKGQKIMAAALTTEGRRVAEAPAYEV